jgi:ACR3 family arsenite efflux pump ArsB
MMYHPLAKVKYSAMPQVFKNTSFIFYSKLVDWSCTYVYISDSIFL